EAAWREHVGPQGGDGQIRSGGKATHGTHEEVTAGTIHRTFKEHAMTTVQAMRIARFGGPEVLEHAEVPVGEPGPGDLRIRHHACGLNFIDVYQRTGLYQIAL